MLSFHARIALAAEAVLLGAAALAIARRMEGGVLAAAAAFVALVLGVRLAVVLLSFGLAGRYRTPPPPGQRLGIAAALRMLGREWASLVALTWAYIPWEAAFVRRDPEVRPGLTPVVLAHGYLANRGYWAPLLRRLEAAGVDAVHVPSLRAWRAPIEHYEAGLAAEIDRIAAAAGRPVVVIAHSMGGLGARAYLARRGPANVARLVTIASPHHGTALARWGVGENARQMRPGSAFLEALRAAEADGVTVPTLSIHSVHDNLVVPQETGRLPWARNVALRGHGHLAIARADEVVELVLAELRDAGVIS